MPHASGHGSSWLQAGSMGASASISGHGALGLGIDHKNGDNPPPLPMLTALQDGFAALPNESHRLVLHSLNSGCPVTRLAQKKAVGVICAVLSLGLQRRFLFLLSNPSADGAADSRAGVSRPNMPNCRAVS